MFACYLHGHGRFFGLFAPLVGPKSVMFDVKMDSGQRPIESVANACGLTKPVHPSRTGRQQRSMIGTELKSKSLLNVSYLSAS